MKHSEQISRIVQDGTRPRQDDGPAAQAASRHAEPRPKKAPESLAELLTIVVRTVGERTTAACIDLLSGLVPAEQIVVVRETPFSKAMRRGFEAALDLNRKWTLAVDADTLVLPDFAQEITAYAQRQQANTFVVQGVVLDKFFNLLRPAGNHLFRTRHLRQALGCIPKEGSSLRPETAMIDAMVDQGYLFIQKPFVAGLHDFDQHYVDIARKCFLQAHKHDYILEHILPVWRKRQIHDRDYTAALVGVAAGLAHEGTVFVDAAFQDAQVAAALAATELTTKPELPASAWSGTRVAEVCRDWLSDPECERMQEIMFPPTLWNRLRGKGMER